MLARAFLSVVSIEPGELDEKICHDIDGLHDALTQLMGMDDLYNFAMNFSLQQAHARLSGFLESEIFLKFTRDWRAKPGIEYVDQALAPKDFPYGKISIQIKNSEAGVGALIIAYKSQYQVGIDRKISLDYLTNLETIQKIKTHNLTYVKKEVLEELEKDIDEINSALRNDRSKERLLLIQEFNKKWQDKFELTVTICLKSNLQRKEMLLQITDKFGAYKTSRSGTNFYVDRCLKPDADALDLLEYSTPFLRLEAPTPASAPVVSLNPAAKKGFTRSQLFAWSAIGVGALATLGAVIACSQSNRPG